MLAETNVYPMDIVRGIQENKAYMNPLDVEAHG